MKRFVYFIAFSCSFVFCQKYYFQPTNFDGDLRWGEHIAYGIDDGSDQAFRQFVIKQISKFNNLFGSYHNFTFVENSIDLYKVDRFIGFRQSQFWECGKTFVFNTEGSYIYLSVHPEDCGEDEAMGLILTVLGFSNLIRRMDRDKFVTLLWDNISPVHKSQLYKDYELFNSTDPIFETFDLDSVMLISSYSPDAADPSQPIMEPVEKTELNMNKLKLYDMERRVTEKDIKQYQSIYHK